MRAIVRIGVVGAGAIGGFLAAALAHCGTDVAVVARGEHLEAIRRHGLRVESDLGAFTARVAAGDDLRRLGAFDFVFLTFKAHQWPALLPQLEPFAGTATTLVTFQNGVPFWFERDPPLASVDPGGRIGARFGDSQIVGGVVHVSGRVAGPGWIRQSGGLRYILGDPEGGTSRRGDALVEVLRDAGLQPESDPNIRATVWLKLVNNAGLNPVSALRRMTIKPMLADPAARAEVRALMEEALRIGQAMQVVDRVDLDARIDYAARLDDVKTSMLQDVEAQRPLEVEPILGALIDLAKRHGVAVPHVRAAYAALRERQP